VRGTSLWRSHTALQIVEQVKALPKFTLEVVEHDTRSFGGSAPVEVDLQITVSAAVGKQHKKKGGQNLTISCLVVTSDMVLIDFRRSAMKNCAFSIRGLMNRAGRVDVERDPWTGP
jgi:hypothetical protein